MDYLNPQKEFRHNIILFIGYGAIAVAIAMTTLVLMYQAYGFGLAKQGQVIQNGLIFFSSHPNPATINLNGVVNRTKTNTRLTVPENTYDVTISRDGYQSWRRTIQVQGGSVHHYDYPFLVPKQLVTKKVANFTKAPALVSQSLDRRWLLVQQAAEISSFVVYDLKNPVKDPAPIALPDAVASKAANSQSWQALEWADDNTHLLLQHNYDDKTEFIMLNRTNPDQSVNLTNTLDGTYSTVTLLNRKYDRYYLYNAPTKNLQTATLQEPAAKSVLQHVINYKSYSDDTLLYAADADTPGKVQIKLRIGTRSYLLRALNAGTTYPLDLTTYSGDLYVVLGASGDNKLVIYKDPVAQLNSKEHSLAPSQVLHVNAPDYVSFSSTAQYIVAEHGNQFAVYDIENDKGYNYAAKQPLDAPAPHATWMDGNRLTYVSGGKLVMFDYDYANVHALMSASPAYLPAYDTDYKYVYAVTVGPTGEASLMQTALLTAADL